MQTELTHFGVPGMKWGHRKVVNVPGSISTQRKTRKEVRRINKEGLYKFYEDRASKAVKQALKDPTSLIKTQTNYSAYPQIVTGKQFIDHLSAGGAINIQATAVYATKATKNGQYVVDSHFLDTYKKVKR